ncbi:MAG: pyrDII [Nocardia sp.]|uniref:iron-sulfur cluster-binding protein n=1 Tax=Nocardia sp. TaxID=1821 RepID=UPI002612BE3E|nr:hypothetical protein [Nocardia sp.]MCU1640746.1 pyrDII [Nocardia sp.]
MMPDLMLPPAGEGPAGRLTPLPGEAAGTSGARVVDAEVVANSHRGDRYWRLRLYAPEVAAAASPGQFVMLTVAGSPAGSPVLPRPMALYDWDSHAGWIDVLYGVVGAGSLLMTGFATDDRMTVVGPLGRGFALDPATRSILLVGRGIGICSLTALAGAAARRGVHVTAVLSARSPAALTGQDVLSRYGIGDLVEVVDADGSSAPIRLAEALIDKLDRQPPEQIFTCGSERLTALCAELALRWNADLQVSLEARMACGLGYCHGCSSGRRTSTEEAPLVCKDGPVFRWHEGE